MSEPWTEAGRALLGKWSLDGGTEQRLTAAILAIEAEAAAREAVVLDTLRRYTDTEPPYPGGPQDVPAQDIARSWQDAHHAWIQHGPTVARAVLSDPSPAAARLLAVVKAARGLRVSEERIAASLAALRGPCDSDEANVMACAHTMIAVLQALRALDGEA